MTDSQHGDTELNRNSVAAVDLFTIAKIELIYRNTVRATDRPRVMTADDAYQILLAHWDHNTIELLEEFHVMLLDNQNRCLGLSDVATGGLSQCVADPKIIFALALQSRAAKILVAHNHPSGETQPSKKDIALTAQLCEAGKFLTLPIIDHLIVTPFAYTSLAQEGLMP